MLRLFQREKVRKQKRRVKQERVIPDDVKYFWSFENNFSVELCEIRQQLFKEQEEVTQK